MTECGKKREMNTLTLMITSLVVALQLTLEMLMKIRSEPGNSKRGYDTRKEFGPQPSSWLKSGHIAYKSLDMETFLGQSKRKIIEDGGDSQKKTKANISQGDIELLPEKEIQGLVRVDIGHNAWVLFEIYSPTDYYKKKEFQRDMEESVI